MKKLTRKTTQVIGKLIDQVADNGELELTATARMPLVVKRLPGEIQMPQGVGYLLSIAQTSAYGDRAMNFIEMSFIVIDKRVNDKDWRNLSIFPQSLMQDHEEEHDESIIIEDGKFKAIKATWHQTHRHFAEEWLTAAKIQPYLK